MKALPEDDRMETRQLPAAIDWRSMNGKSYVSAVKNQVRK